MRIVDRRDFLSTTGAWLAAGAMSVTSRAMAATLLPAQFKLGLVTYNIAKDWDLPTILQVCKQTHIAAVECRTTHKHGVEPSLNAEQRKEVKKRFEDSGIVFWGCGTVCEFHAIDSAVVKKNIEECKRFVDLVKDLGGKGVKVRPNGVHKTIPYEKTFEQIGKSLIECGKAAADAGVEIWVEVHGGTTQEPANMKTIMEHCGHKSVGITWNSNPPDVVNGSVKASFEMLQPWLKSCHINDLEKDATGAYPYRELFRLLREMKYDRYTLIEVSKTPKDVPSGIAMLKEYHALWSKLVAEGS